MDKALCKTYKNDIDLIDCLLTDDDSRSNEKKLYSSVRAIVFRITHYFESFLEKDVIFSRNNLDCEYNRNMWDVKVLPSFENGALPNVILYQIKNNTHNLMVMEFKGYWNNKAMVYLNDTCG